MRSYLFGPFRLDPGARLLLREGQPVPLVSKAFETLLVLVENRGRVVEKGELLRRVWPDMVVEEANLAQSVFMLRRALGESHDQHPFIATVPRRGYQFVAEVREAEPAPAHASPSTAPKTVSLAVLPFAWLGAGADDEHLGLGMADALITRLGNVSQIQVRPTSAVRRYLGAVPDPLAAARELGVDVLLEGSVRKAGERIRVTVQLVSAGTGGAIWGERFDEGVADIFDLEDSMSERLAQALVPSLTREQRQRVTSHDTEDREAHVSYLKGRHLWNQRTDESLAKAIRHFEAALVRDPRYALAWAGLADCWTLVAGARYGAPTPAHDALGQARTAAERALQLDGELAEAHASLALVKFRLDWDWVGAESEFQRALVLDPGCASAHHLYGLCLAALGRAEQAIASIQRAQELDPLSLNIAAALARVFHFARRHERALEHCRKLLEIDPRFAGAHFDLALCYVQIGRCDEAVAELQEAIRLSGGGSLETAILGYIQARAGRKDEARRLLAELTQRKEDGEAFHRACVHAGLGETAEALSCLEAALEERFGLLVWLKVEPLFDGLRSEPRFAALLREMRLD